MSGAWVAGSVRAAALARRRVGAAGARSLSQSTSVNAATAQLADTPYGRYVRGHHSLAEAEHAVAATLPWHMRVLAGWLPPHGAPTMRALAAGFEIANVDEHLRRIDGLEDGPLFRLGSLATSWPRLAGASSAAELARQLGATGWGRPGGDRPADIRSSMRRSWAARVARVVPEARSWAAGAAALLVAREPGLPAGGLPPSQQVTASALLGSGWAQTRSLPPAVAIR